MAEAGVDISGGRPEHVGVYLDERWDLVGWKAAHMGAVCRMRLHLERQFPGAGPAKLGLTLVTSRCHDSLPQPLTEETKWLRNSLKRKAPSA